jgi:hypothetical protein
MIKNVEYIRSELFFTASLANLIEYNSEFESRMRELNIPVTFIKTNCGHNMECLLEEIGDDFFSFVKEHIMYSFEVH